MRASLAASLVTASFFVLATSMALAQDATPAPVPVPPASMAPPGPAAAPPPQAPAAPPAGYAPPPPGYPTPQPVPVPEPEFVGPRFRWGASLLGGPLVLGIKGGAVGLDLRLGAQLTQTVGIYAQPVALAGAGAVVDESSFSGTAGFFGATGVGALVDFTFGDTFFLAVGPEFMAVDVAAFTANLGGISEHTESGTYVSITGRIGVALGSKKPTGRKAFTIGLHPHVVISQVPFFVATLALGYDSF